MRLIVTGAFAVTLLAPVYARADDAALSKVEGRNEIDGERLKPARPHCVGPAIVSGILGAGAGAGIGYAIAGGMDTPGGVASVFLGETVGASLLPIPACAVASEDPRLVPAASFVIAGLYLGGGAGGAALFGIGQLTGPVQFMDGNWIALGAVMWTFIGGGIALGAYGGWRVHQWRERTNLTVTPTANGFSVGGSF